MGHRNCLECGTSFVPSRFAKRHDYCSDRCSATAYERTAPLFDCRYCLRPFRTRDKRSLGYCSKSCGNKAPNIGKSCSLIGHSCALTWRTCDECGERFTSQFHRKLCSPGCGRKRNARQVRDYYRAQRIGVERVVKCRECGLVVDGRRTDDDRWKTRTVYCSELCSRRHTRRDGKVRRAQRKRGAGYESVYRRVVYERDGWTCQLCGFSVRRDAVVPHPMSPTLDHIVPLSAGGEHSYRNVQLAHFRCNTLRGADGPAQMRLIS